MINELIVGFLLLGIAFFVFSVAAWLSAQSLAITETFAVAAFMSLLVSVLLGRMKGKQP